MVGRRGASSVGCLVSLLLAAAALYFGVNIGRVYWRFYQYQDAMKQEARFAARNSDDQIKAHLLSLADSLGLPESAGKVRVRRNARHISISTSYYERIELPLVVREVLFTPQAEWTF
jgi:hypothetical protein